MLDIHAGGNLLILDMSFPEETAQNCLAIIYLVISDNEIDVRIAN